jgi:hypothetical protein
MYYRCHTRVSNYELCILVVTEQHVVCSHLHVHRLAENQIYNVVLNRNTNLLDTMYM